jgi:hypothetical protein
MKKPYTQLIFDEECKGFRGVAENDGRLSIVCSFLTSDIGCSWNFFRK